MTEVDTKGGAMTKLGEFLRSGRGLAVAAVLTSIAASTPQAAADAMYSGDDVFMTEGQAPTDPVADRIDALGEQFVGIVALRSSMRMQNAACNEAADHLRKATRAILDVAGREGSTARDRLLEISDMATQALVDTPEHEFEYVPEGTPAATEPTPATTPKRPVLHETAAETPRFFEESVVFGTDTRFDASSFEDGSGREVVYDPRGIAKSLAARIDAETVGIVDLQDKTAACLAEVDETMGAMVEVMDEGLAASKMKVAAQAVLATLAERMESRPMPSP